MSTFISTGAAIKDQMKVPLEEVISTSMGGSIRAFVGSAAAVVGDRMNAIAAENLSPDLYNDKNKDLAMKMASKYLTSGDQANNDGKFAFIARLACFVILSATFKNRANYGKRVKIKFLFFVAIGERIF
jgi:hypothetical protein